MTVIEALKTLLRCEMVDGATASHAIINETDETTKLHKVTLSELGPGMLVLKVDEGRKVKHNGRLVAVCMSPLLTTTGDTTHNRACDVVIVRELSGATGELYYIDLKSDSPTSYEGQFISTRCFFRYVQELARQFLAVEMTICKERFIILHTDTSGARRSLGKQKTRFGPKAANGPNEPDKYIVRDGEIVRCTSLF